MKIRYNKKCSKCGKFVKIDKEGNAEYHGKIYGEGNIVNICSGSGKKTKMSKGDWITMWF